MFTLHDETGLQENIISTWSVKVLNLSKPRFEFLQGCRAYVQLESLTIYYWKTDSIQNIKVEFVYSIMCFSTADPVDTKEPSSTGSCQISPWWNDRRYEKLQFLHSEMFLTALICSRIKLRTSCCFQCIGTSFRRVIPDSGPASNNPEKVRKLLLCTGKVFYELAKVRVL